MGTYATTTSLQTLMVGTNFNTATSNLASLMITHSENEIDKYLSKRYDLSSSPFNTSTSVPPLITSLCETMSEGFLYLRLSRGSKESVGRGNDLIKMVTDNLKELAGYKLDLVDTSGSVVSDMSQTSYRVLSNTKNYHSTFDEDDSLLWSIDSDKLSDIKSGRS